MHLISFDASPRQVSKIRNGHSVRIKKGRGFNLVVNPSTYHLVSRAFTKNKGVQIKLSDEELDANKSLSPEQHSELAEGMDKNLFDELPFAEGGSIFKKAVKSKVGKQIRKDLKPLGRELLKIGKEHAHQKIAEAHMKGAEWAGEDEAKGHFVNALAGYAHEKAENVGKRGGSLKSRIHKLTSSKHAKSIRRDLKPVGRELLKLGKEMAHQKLAEAQMAGADYVPDDEHARLAYSLLGQYGHEKIAGLGLGAGMNAHEALQLANMATANANYQLAKMHNASVHGQITQPPLRQYWDEPMAPISRGTGLRNHMNLIRGRGSLISQDAGLPQALQSQPYGANWHMQFFLPPEYHRYNDGGMVEGKGLYI